jgi:hypothetical protein
VSVAGGSGLVCAAESGIVASRTAVDGVDDAFCLALAFGCDDGCECEEGCEE